MCGPHEDSDIIFGPVSSEISQSYILHIKYVEKIDD